MSDNPQPNPPQGTNAPQNPPQNSGEPLGYAPPVYPSAPPPAAGAPWPTHAAPPQRPPQGPAAAPPPPGWGAAAPPPAMYQQQMPPQGPPPPHWGAPPPQGYGPPPPGWRPNAAPPAPPRRPVALLVGLALFLALLGGGFMLLLATLGSGPGAGGTTTNTGGMFSFGDRIAVLEVNGVLGEGPGYGADTEALVRQIREWEKNASIKGIVLRINSPGGAVSATQDLYQAIQEYRTRTKKPVVASMGDIAASGGYYTAMAADRVFANPGTLTGSIGVILNFWDTQGIQQKIGIGSHVIKSGDFKDIGSSSRPMTPEEKALLDDMVVNVYEEFLNTVIANRGTAVREALARGTQLAPDSIDAERIATHVKGYADGRIFSGDQAMQSGMIDEIGTLADAVRYVQAQAGLKGEPTLVRGPIRPRGLFGALESQVQKLGTQAIPGGISMEYRLAFP